MNKLKKFFMVLLIAMLLPLTNISLAGSQGQAKLESLVTEMLEEASLEELRSPKARQRIEENDARLQKKFDRLSLEEKYQVMELLRQRQASPDRLLSSEEREDEKILAEMITLAKKEGVFLGDLSEKELKKYSKRTKAYQRAQSSQFSRLLHGDDNDYCPLVHYDTWIKKADPGGRQTYGASYFRGVINDPDEWICDYELRFDVSKPRVWGKTKAARMALFFFGGGLHKRTVGGKDHLVVGAMKSFVMGFDPRAAVDSFVIW